MYVFALLGESPVCNVSPVEMNTYITQILVSNTILQLNGLGLLGELSDPRTQQNGPAASYSAKK